MLHMVRQQHLGTCTKVAPDNDGVDEAGRARPCSCGYDELLATLIRATKQQPIPQPNEYQHWLIERIADKIEDGTLFKAGMVSNAQLADTVRAFIAAAGPKAAG